MSVEGRLGPAEGHSEVQEIRNEAYDTFGNYLSQAMLGNDIWSCEMEPVIARSSL